MAAKIEDTLKLFNRKERYWVVRTTLGAPSATLSDRFCAAINRELVGRADPITPATAWWAMDYHFDWLQAALRLHPEVSAASPPMPLIPSRDGKRFNIQGQQEDIDLVIAHGRDVILVEAKGFGAWSNTQLESKLERLRELPICWDSGEVIPERDSAEAPIRVHFILMSPSRPSKLTQAVSSSWPAWAKRGELPCWVELEVETSEAGYFKVTRCNEAGMSSAVGRHWRPVRDRRFS